MLRHVEDLPGEIDAGAERARANGVQRRGETGTALRGEGATRMRHRDHREHERKAPGGRQVIPVRGNEEQHSRDQQQAAEPEGDQREAAPACGAAMFGLPGTDAIRSHSIDETRGRPASKRRLPGTTHPKCLRSIAS